METTSGFTDQKADQSEVMLHEVESHLQAWAAVVAFMRENGVREMSMGSLRFVVGDRPRYDDGEEDTSSKSPEKRWHSAPAFRAVRTPGGVDR